MKNKDFISAPATTGLGFGFNFRETGISVLGEVRATLKHGDGCEEIVVDKIIRNVKNFFIKTKVLKI